MANSVLRGAYLREADVANVVGRRPHSTEAIKWRVEAFQNYCKPCGNTGGGAAGRYINPTICAE